MINRLLLTLLAVLALPALAQQSPTDASTSTAVPAAGTSLESLLAQLPDADFATKRDLVTALAGTGSPAALNVLSAMLDGRLFYRLSDKLVVVAQKDADPLTVVDARTGQVLPPAPAAEFDRVTTNNGLRKALRGAIAQAQLSSADAAVRLAAVDELTRNLDEDSVALLRTHLASEKDAAVREATGNALAISDLHPEGQSRQRGVRAPQCDGRERRGRRAGGSGPDGACGRCRRRQAHAALAQLLLQHRDPAVRAEPGVGAGAGRHWPRSDLRRHGRDQHGPWRTDDDRCLHRL